MVGPDRVLHLQPVDQVVAEIAVEDVARLVRRPHRIAVLDQVGVELVGEGGVEAVEIVEAHAVGPMVEGPHLAVLPDRGVVVLAEEGGVIAVVVQHPPDGGGALGDHRGVALLVGGDVGDRSRGHGMMVAAGEQGRPRRRAHGHGVEGRIAQPVRRQGVEGGRRDRTAEGRGGAEADVVGHHQQHVGRAGVGAGLGRIVVPLARLGRWGLSLGESGPGEVQRGHRRQGRGGGGVAQSGDPRSLPHVARS